MKEMHHRVTIIHQIISSLVRRLFSKSEDPNTQELLRESRHRIRTMALIHERLYGSKDVGRINLGHYVRELSDFLMRAYAAEAGGISLALEVEDVSLELDRAVPCGLILHELLSNTLKHAFAPGEIGSVRIELSLGDDLMSELTVSDTGCGLPEEFDPETPGSFGLQLVHLLVQQLGGSLEYEHLEGTTVRIRFRPRGAATT